MTKTTLGRFLAMAWVCAAGAAGCGDEGGVCFYGGERHQVGERFPDTDGCNTCECRTDGVACTMMGCRHDDGGPPDVVALPEAPVETGGPVTCSYGGTTYQVGATFKDTEDCNTCRCSSNGLVACTVMACIRSATTPPSDEPATFETGARGN